MSCSLWLRYGQLIGDSFVILVNVFGAALEISYTLIYMYYSSKKSVVLRQFVAAIIFVATIYIYSIVEEDRSLAVKRVGFFELRPDDPFLRVTLDNAGTRYQGSKCRKLTVSRDSGDARRIVPMVRVRSTLGRSLHTNAKFLGLCPVRFSTRIVRYLPKEKTRPNSFNIDLEMPLRKYHCADFPLREGDIFRSYSYRKIIERMYAQLRDHECSNETYNKTIAVLVNLCQMFEDSSTKQDSG